MIQVGQIRIDDDEVEYSNSQMKLKINNGDFQRGKMFLSSR